LITCRQLRVWRGRDIPPVLGLVPNATAASAAPSMTCRRGVRRHVADVGVLRRHVVAIFEDQTREETKVALRAQAKRNALSRSAGVLIFDQADEELAWPQNASPNRSWNGTVIGSAEFLISLAAGRE
jgi:hypothetical protein